MKTEEGAGPDASCPAVLVGASRVTAPWASTARTVMVGATVVVILASMWTTVR